MTRNGLLCVADRRIFPLRNLIPGRSSRRNCYTACFQTRIEIPEYNRADCK